MSSHTTVPLTHNRAPIPLSTPITPTHQVHINPHNPEAPKDLRSIVFTPDLDTSAIVIQSLLDPNKSIAGIALENKTTIEALSTWMVDPDIALRIFNMKRAAAVQHSLAATFQLKHATNALVIILQEFADSACHAAGIQAGRGASPSEHIRRDRETARKASHLLARLANFDQSIRLPRPARSPLPRPGGGGAERSKAEGVSHAHDQPREALDDQSLLTEIHALLAHVGAQPHSPQPAITAPDTTPEFVPPETTTLASEAREAGDRRLPDAPASGNAPTEHSSPVKRASEPHTRPVLEPSASETPRSWRGGRNTLSPGRENPELDGENYSEPAELAGRATQNRPAPGRDPPHPP